MSEIFKSIPAIKYEGSKSKNPLAFKFYDPEKVVLGKTKKITTRLSRNLLFIVFLLQLLLIIVSKP